MARASSVASPDCESEDDDKEEEEDSELDDKDDDGEDGAGAWGRTKFGGRMHRRRSTAEPAPPPAPPAGPSLFSMAARLRSSSWRRRSVSESPPAGLPWACRREASPRVLVKEALYGSKVDGSGGGGGSDGSDLGSHRS